MLSRILKAIGRSATPDRADEDAVAHAGLDLTTPDAVANFARMATSELAELDACRLDNGGVLLLNPDDVKSAFSRKDFSNEPSRFSAIAPRNVEKFAAAQVAANIPPFLDAPRHTCVRKWLSKCVLTTLSDVRDSIDGAAERYVATLSSDVPSLLVEETARNFAASAICTFAGVKLSAEELKKYTAALFKLFAPIQDATSFGITNEALASARRALLAQIRTQTGAAPASLLKTMQAWDHLLDDLNLSDEERDILVADNILLVLADGVENVEAAIGNVMVSWCALNPDQRPEITEGYVRGCIRQATPGQTIARITTQEIHIGGMKCPVGSPVFLSLAGANARASDDDGDFSFGMGRHRCIGEGLAIEVIVACCKHLSKRSPIIDTRDLRFEPVFGHRWMRGVTLSLAASGNSS